MLLSTETEFQARVDAVKLISEHLAHHADARPSMGNYEGTQVEWQTQKVNEVSFLHAPWLYMFACTNQL
jgi:hypothetical protein